MYLLMGIFMLAFGVLMVASPETVYELKESWKSYSVGDPSQFYIISTRIGGVLFIIAGISGIVVQFMG